MEPAVELKRLQDLNGRRVDHQPGEGKDMSDARAAAAWWACRSGSGTTTFEFIGRDTPIRALPLRPSGSDLQRAALRQHLRMLLP